MAYVKNTTNLIAAKDDLQLHNISKKSTTYKYLNKPPMGSDAQLA